MWPRAPSEMFVFGPRLESDPWITRQPMECAFVAESWKQAKASDVTVGDVIRTQNGDVVKLSRIEEGFMGN